MSLLRIIGFELGEKMKNLILTTLLLLGTNALADLKVINYSNLKDVTMKIDARYRTSSNPSVIVMTLKTIADELTCEESLGQVMYPDPKATDPFAIKFAAILNNLVTTQIEEGTGRFVCTKGYVIANPELKRCTFMDAVVACP